MSNRKHAADDRLAAFVGEGTIDNAFILTTREAGRLADGALHHILRKGHIFAPVWYDDWRDRPAMPGLEMTIVGEIPACDTFSRETIYLVAREADLPF